MNDHQHKMFPDKSYNGRQNLVLKIIFVTGSFYSSQMSGTVFFFFCTLKAGCFVAGKRT